MSTNPLVGEKGAAHVFAPQKGASEVDVPKLEKVLSHLSNLVKEATGREIGQIKHGGAAGGVAAVLNGLFDAKLRDGAQAILDLIDFDEKVNGADIVITGEGQLDNQTLGGKAPAVVAFSVQAAGKQVVGFFGQSKLENKNHPFDQIITINQPKELLVRVNRKNGTKSGKSCL